MCESHSHAGGRGVKAMPRETRRKSEAVLPPPTADMADKVANDVGKKSGGLLGAAEQIAKTARKAMSGFLGAKDETVMLRKLEGKKDVAETVEVLPSGEAETVAALTRETATKAALPRAEQGSDHATEEVLASPTTSAKKPEIHLPAVISFESVLNLIKDTDSLDLDRVLKALEDEEKYYDLSNEKLAIIRAAVDIKCKERATADILLDLFAVVQDLSLCKSLVPLFPDQGALIRSLVLAEDRRRADAARTTELEAPQVKGETPSGTRASVTQKTSLPEKPSFKQVLNLLEGGGKEVGVSIYSWFNKGSELWELQGLMNDEEVRVLRIYINYLAGIMRGEGDLAVDIITSIPASQNPRIFEVFYKLLKDEQNKNAVSESIQLRETELKAGATQRPSDLPGLQAEVAKKAAAAAKPVVATKPAEQAASVEIVAPEGPITAATLVAHLRAANTNPMTIFEGLSATLKASLTADQMQAARDAIINRCNELRKTVVRVPSKADLGMDLKRAGLGSDAITAKRRQAPAAQPSITLEGGVAKASVKPPEAKAPTTQAQQGGGKKDAEPATPSAKPEAPGIEASIKDELETILGAALEAKRRHVDVSYIETWANLRSILQKSAVYRSNSGLKQGRYRWAVRRALSEIFGEGELRRIAPYFITEQSTNPD